MPYSHRTDGSQTIELKKIPTNSDGGLEKATGLARAEEIGRELSELQDLMYYAGTHSMLIVLQGMDSAGKDGAIRFILDHSNAQGTRAVAFKVPTEIELEHDFLWRIHYRAPKRGEFVIFNRSHYEDVVVVRVHDLVPKAQWSKRYAHINAFEANLVDHNVLVVKFFLHISKEEQKARLLARETDPTKAWKLAVADWREREHWDEYQRAYEDAINRCATPDAPWVIVPSDRKWFRNLAIAEVLVETLRPYKDDWMRHLAKVGDAARAELTEYRKTHGIDES